MKRTPKKVVTPIRKFQEKNGPASYFRTSLYFFLKPVNIYRTNAPNIQNKWIHAISVVLVDQLFSVHNGYSNSQDKTYYTPKKISKNV